MDVLIGVSAGVIGLILGVVGIATAFHPPQKRETKVALTIVYVALSAIAIITTVIDRVAAANEADLSKKQMNELVESSRRQTDDFLKLTAQLETQKTAFADSNQALREQLSNLRVQGTDGQSSSVKARIESLLKNIDSFIRKRTEGFSQRTAKMSQEEYKSSNAYMKFREELSAEYVGTYVQQVIALLNEAADAGAAEKQQYAVDDRFVQAGLIPYLEELRDAYSRLHD